MCLDKGDSLTHFNETVNGFEFNVYYNSATMNTLIVSNIVSEIVNVYNYFVTNRSFNEPIPYNSSVYNFYLVDDGYITGDGETLFYASTGQSYIFLKYTSLTSSTAMMEDTIAHEFFHAIMASYNIPYVVWFHEGFASMAGLIYSGVASSWYNTYVTSYLSTSYYSIYYGSGFRPYGTLVFPLYIYTHIYGWPEIHSILSSYNSAGDVYTAITNSTYISSYRAAFAGSVSQNYDPDNANYSLYLANSGWGTASINSQTLPFSGSNMGVQPMASHYQRFSSSTDIGTLYITLEVTSGGSSGLYCNKIIENSSNNLSISTVAINTTRVTIQQTNFGSTSARNVVVIPINTNSSGTTIVYSLTASVS